MLSESDFNELANQGYNRIPLMCEILADLDTPLSTYTMISHSSYSYLFESVEGGEKGGRYSIIGLPANKIISIIKAPVLQALPKRLSVKINHYFLLNQSYF